MWAGTVLFVSLAHELKVSGACSDRKALARTVLIIIVAQELGSVV